MDWPTQLRFKKPLLVFIAVGWLAWLGLIPLRIKITLHQVPEPQAILVLGGDYQRTKLAAQFSKTHPDLEIWLSDDARYSKYHQRFFNRFDVPRERVHYDWCATDTVTNFTCTLDYFTEQNIRHVYLITSDYHLPRSLAIATLVFGGRGIAVTPVAIPSKGQQPESKLHILRDSIRSLVWIVTGWTGANFND